MSNHPPSRLDANQVLQYAFDDTTQRLRTDAEATLVNAEIDINLDASDDTVAIADKDTLDTLKINPDGSINVTTAGDISTEAKQDIGNASLSSIDSKLPTLSGGRIPVDIGGATVNITGPVTVSNEVEVKNDTGNPIPIIDSVESYEVLTNSSTSPLLAGATFTGDAFDVSKYSVINVNVFSNVSSATDGIKVQFSPDGTNWDHEHKTTYTATSGVGFIFNAEYKFARVVYVNGATNQTTFRLQTILKKGYAESSLYTLDQTVKGGMFSKLVKAALTAKNPSGDYVSIDCTNGGNLKVSIEEVEGTLPVNTGLTQPLTDTQLRASAVPVTVSGVATAANQDTTNSRIGTLTETSPASDTASSGLNGRLQRIAQRITSLINILPPFRGKQLQEQSLSVTMAINEILDINLRANSFGFLSTLTSTTGASDVLLDTVGKLCKSMVVQNSTGVTIEVRSIFTEDYNNEVFYLPTGSFATFKVNNTSYLSVKRLDNSNTQVRVTAYWEN